MSYCYYPEVDVSDLLGKTLISVTYNRYNDEIHFETEDHIYKMYHSQECCESVSIEDISGDLQDLVGHQILEAEEVCKSGDLTHGDTETWTFYKFGTIKGHVNIRWYGSSNGYYSESVNFIKKPK